jgi:hypothetical protein
MKGNGAASAAPGTKTARFDDAWNLGAETERIWTAATWFAAGTWQSGHLPLCRSSPTLAEVETDIFFWRNGM